MASIDGRVPLWPRFNVINFCYVTVFCGSGKWTLHRAELCWIKVGATKAAVMYEFVKQAHAGHIVDDIYFTMEHHSN